MKAKKLLLNFFFLSLAFHIVFLSFFSLRIQTQKRTDMNAFPGILNKNELWKPEAVAKLPKEIKLSTDRARKEYFSLAFNLLPALLPDKDIDSQTPARLKPKKAHKSRENILFLWNKENALGKEGKEVPYRALVSAYGKIILIYPEKLIFDSRKNIAYNRYLRESAYSFKEDFFWTKLDVLVK